MSAIEESEPNTTVQTGEPDGEFANLKKQAVEAWRARSKWRKMAKECYDFVAGRQWSEEDIRKLTEQNRPPVVFNRIAPIIKAICGLEVNNRQGIVCLPRTVESSGPNELRTAAIKWVRDECYAEDEESTSFRDNAICGEGVTETRMEYEEDPKGKIIEERIFPMEIACNKGAKRPNYTDARMVMRARQLAAEDAKDMFPGFSAEAIDAKWLGDMVTPSDGGEGNKKDYPDETRAGVFSAMGKNAQLTVVQVQWWEREQRYLIAQEGEEKLQDLSKEEFDKFKERAELLAQAGQPVPAYQHAVVPKRVYYEAFLGATSVLTDEKGEGKKKLPLGQFNFKFMTGDRDEQENFFYGVVRDMLDPQRWANKWLSQTMHILNTNAKGGIMAEKGAFDNVAKAEKDWADNTKIVWLKSGQLDKVKERTPPPLPQGLDNLMNFALTSLRDVTGVNLELLGQADREQAASLEAQRRQSAMTILATLFDSLRRYRKHQGKLLLAYLNLLPDNTLIRTGEGTLAKYVPLIKDPESVEYDVIVDEAPSSPNQKQAQWMIITQLMGSGIQFPMPVLLKLLKYSPLSESAVQDIQSASGMGSEMPPEMLQQKLQQAEQALKVMEDELKKMMEENNQLENDKSIEMMKIAVDEYKAETERLNAEWQSEISLAQANAAAAATPSPSES